MNIQQMHIATDKSFSLKWIMFPEQGKSSYIPSYEKHWIVKKTGLMNDFKSLIIVKYITSSFFIFKF